MALKVTSFRKTVTTAGVAVPLSSANIFTESFVIRALSANTGVIYVGDSSSANSTSGMFLAAGDANSKDAKPVTRGALQKFNLKLVYINSSVNGEGVIVEYVTEE